MQKFNFTVSPDFEPSKTTGWYVFNTWLQKQTGLAIHLELYNSFSEQRQAVVDGNVDLIYANAYDAAMLAREHGFKPIAKVIGQADEAMIITAEGNKFEKIEDLSTGLSIAAADVPDINMISMRMLEPADLDDSNTTIEHYPSFIAAAKHVIKGEKDVAFFLAPAYENLSKLVKSQLKSLITSQIDVMHHTLLIGPNMLEHRDAISQLLTGTPASDSVFQTMEIEGWEQVSDEDMEFMIDLTETLRE